jgi:uncharacterized protein (TIGR03435 family)
MHSWVAQLLIAAGLAAASFAQTPEFEAVSIKPCGQTTPPPGAEGGRRGNASRAASPDRLFLGCMTARRLVIQAMMNYGSAKIDSPWNFSGFALQVQGGPAWFDADRYTVDAVVKGTPSRAVMNGPMLHAVLEERFHLRAHREEREVPIWELTVAPGGLKLLRDGDRSCTEPDAGGPARDGRPFLPIDCSKLRRAQEGACVEGPPTEDKPHCGLRGLFGPSRHTLDIIGGTMDEIASAISGNGAGRPVVNETGLTGKYDAHLEFAPADAPPTDAPDGVPALPAVLGKLGLRLRPARAMRPFLVVDHVERPTDN